MELKDFINFVLVVSILIFLIVPFDSVWFLVLIGVLGAQGLSWIWARIY